MLIIPVVVLIALFIAFMAINLRQLGSGRSRFLAAVRADSMPKLTQTRVAAARS